jgi:hypothetical protein
MNDLPDNTELTQDQQKKKSSRWKVWLGWTVGYGFVLGAGSKHHPLRGFVIGALVGGVFLPLLLRFAIWLRKRGVRASLTILIAFFLIPVIVSGSGDVVNYPQYVWDRLPETMFSGLLLGLSFFVFLELDWKHRWLPVAVSAFIGMCIGVWMFYHVTHDFPLLITRSMLRPELGPVSLFFDALFSSVYATSVAYIVAGLLFIFLDRHSQYPRLGENFNST